MLFRKRPPTVEAIQFTGDNADECRTFVGDPNAKFDIASKQLMIRGALSSTPVHRGFWIVKDSVDFH